MRVIHPPKFRDPSTETQQSSRRTGPTVYIHEQTHSWQSIAQGNADFQDIRCESFQGAQGNQGAGIPWIHREEGGIVDCHRDPPLHG